MKVGMTLPSFVAGVDGPTIREWCRRIDDGPYSCVAVGERVAYPSHDLITSLAFAAAATRRVPHRVDHRGPAVARPRADRQAGRDDRRALRRAPDARRRRRWSRPGLPRGRHAPDPTLRAPRRARRDDASGVAGRLAGPRRPADRADARSNRVVRRCSPRPWGPKSLARSAVWADGLSGFDLAPDPDVGGEHVRVGARRVGRSRAERPAVALDVELVRAR